MKGLGRRKNRWKNWAIPVVGIVLVALVLEAVESRRPGADNPVNHGLSSIAAPFLRLGAWAREKSSVLTDAVGGARQLRDENERLRARLLEEQLRSATDISRHALATIAQDISTNIPPGSYDLIHAPVIAGPARTGRQQMWLAVGANDGVREGMAALGPQGIVGLVTEVHDTSARVVLITDSQAAWGAQVASSSDLGLLRGTGDPSLVEFQFERTAVDARPGDIVVSSGMMGSLAPAGMQFGVVEDLTWNKNGEPVARVRLPSPPGSLRTVFVVPLRQITLEGRR